MLLGEGSLGDRPATVPQHVHRPSGILRGPDEFPVRGRFILGRILQTPAGTGVAASVRRGAYQGGFDRRHTVRIVLLFARAGPAGKSDRGASSDNLIFRRVGVDRWPVRLAYAHFVAVSHSAPTRNYQQLQPLACSR